jgi:hypothetical protein
MLPSDVMHKLDHYSKLFNYQKVVFFFKVMFTITKGNVKQHDNHDSVDALLFQRRALKTFLTI